MFREESPESLKQLIYGGTIAFLLLAGFVIFFLLMYMRRKTRNILEKEQLRSAFQKELLQAQLEIQEHTLKTISEEIHDNIGQVLSLAKLKLNTINTAEEAAVQEKIADSKKLVSKAIQDLRDLSRSLNTDNIAAMGLLRAVEYQLEMIRKSGFETVLEIKCEQRRLEPQQELIVFRIIQEALNNIIKHAQATKIIFAAEYRTGELRLTVKDNGKGTTVRFKTDEQELTGSLGLRNMQNRAALIGAVFSFESQPDHGACVSLIIPIKQD